jgi:hypothetical protein
VFHQQHNHRRHNDESDTMTTSNTTPDAQTITTMMEKPRKKKRVFLWFFLAVQAIFLVWIISGMNAASGGPTGDCGSLSKAACNDAQDIGTGIGVMLVVGLWMTVDFFLAVGYGIYRLAKRP